MNSGKNQKKKKFGYQIFNLPFIGWPSADIGNNTMRKSVTFSSQPQLEDESCVARLPAIDLLHLRLTHQQAAADARKGLIDRIIGMYSCYMIR